MTSPSVLSRYAGADLGTRLFLALRYRFTPYARMSAELPARGRIADLGCGHGLFALALAAGHPAREVLGIDHDPARVALAQKAAGELSNLAFEPGSVLELPASAQGPFDGIALIDVMHYFDPPTQERILAQAIKRLAPGGRLIFREVDPAGGPASRFNRLYERVATLSGFTRTDEEKLHFRTPREWEALLSRLGLEARSERCSHFLFADVLFVGRRTGSRTDAQAEKPRA